MPTITQLKTRIYRPVYSTESLREPSSDIWGVYIRNPMLECQLQIARSAYQNIDELSKLNKDFLKLKKPFEH